MHYQPFVKIGFGHDTFFYAAYVRYEFQVLVCILNELLIIQIIANLLIVLRMAELALVDYFVMGEAIGIVATLFVSFYFSRKQMQKLSVDIETKVLSDSK
jgi:hypothetical protein